jgi:hypothetical protein
VNVSASGHEYKVFPVKIRRNVLIEMGDANRGGEEFKKLGKLVENGLVHHGDAETQRRRIGFVPQISGREFGFVPARRGCESGSFREKRHQNWVRS